MSALAREKKMYSFYDFSRLLSHNAVYNFCVGARGLGKTYGAKKFAIRKFLKNGEQFIYLRRYQTELKTRNTFFDDIAHEFPDVEFRILGSEMQVCRNPEAEKKQWDVMGFFAALSNAQNRKSVAYPNVTLIIFDEFILEKGHIHYLPEEENVFNNFYSTVDRWQDKTKVMFLANSVSIQNPYFLAYDIKPEREFVKAHDGFIVVHFADSKQFASEVSETKFGRFIKGTQYEDYALHSVFADNHSYLIARKASEARYYVTLETKTGVFSVWIDRSVYPFMYYFQEDRPKNEIIITTEPSKMSEDKIYVPYSDKMLQYFRAAFGRACAKFDSPRTRNNFVQIFKR